MKTPVQPILSSFENKGQDSSNVPSPAEKGVSIGDTDSSAAVEGKIFGIFPQHENHLFTKIF